MNGLRAFLAEGFQFELDRFRVALTAIPEGEFHTPRLGHSAAWHALHVAEWLRFFPLQDCSATYAHLGWENAGWRSSLLGTPPVAEEADKSSVLAELDRVGGLLVSHVRNLRDDELDDRLYAPAAPSGERPRLVALRLALTHINYHRGQLLLSHKDHP